jgi:hypothetical protein
MKFELPKNLADDPATGQCPLLGGKARDFRSLCPSGPPLNLAVAPFESDPF